MNGLWVLAFIVRLDTGDIRIEPYEYFNDGAACVAWRDREARETLRLMTCYRVYDYEV